MLSYNKREFSLTNITVIVAGCQLRWSYSPDVAQYTK